MANSSSVRNTSGWSLQSHLIVCLDGSEHHHQLKTQQVVCADGLQLQQFTQSDQLGALQVLQRQLVLKQLRKPDNVLRGGLLACAPHLPETHRHNYLT